MWAKYTLLVFLPLSVVSSSVLNEELSDPRTLASEISVAEQVEIDDLSSLNKNPFGGGDVPSDSSSIRSFIEEFQQNIDRSDTVSTTIEERVLEAQVVPSDNSTNITIPESPEEDGGNSTSNLVSCTTGKEPGGEPVELVNSTRLMSILVTESNITNRRSSADCVAVLFYARYCPFSCMAAPHFNALHRAYPDIKMAAVDAMKHPSFNTQYGIVGVPTVMLFHNGRPAAKFNDSEYTLEMFARFIMKYTGLEPQHKLYVTSADFGGPVPSVPTRETDYCLVLSWIFILVCGVYYFSKSVWWHWIVEAVQNTWREAEAQHEHGD